MFFQRCLFCGGNANEQRHAERCDGRQGAREAALEAPDFAPMLISGIDPATHDTSAEAAARIEDERATQRRLVFDAIRAAGHAGRTDDELQVLLALDGSSERPRRWELWKRDAIRVLRDAEGRKVTRLTRTHRSAVVWVCAEERHDARTE